MGVEDGELFLKGLGEEPGDYADSIAPCPWIDGDLEGSWTVRFVRSLYLLEDLKMRGGRTHESQNVSQAINLKTDL